MTDQLLVANEKLTRAVERLTQRVDYQEQLIKTMLDTMKKSEDLFELRSSQVISGLFKGLTHQLDHTIEHAQEQLRLEMQGFDIKVVDGVTHKENEQSIIVVKTETGYNYSPVVDPTNVMNDNTETFNEYFNKHPEIFGERTEIIVNIIVMSKPTEAE